MSQNLLKNGGFEADWGEKKSHRCLVFPEDGGVHEKDVGNIFTPPGWMTWFRHDPGTWDQPEVRDAWAQHDPRRVHSGQKGILLFTFYRKHDAGFLQQVQVAPGTKLRATAWAHAWSNCHGREHTDDPRWSEGPGFKQGVLLEGQDPPADSPGTPDDWRNFTFYVGIDPTGGTDPFADTVVWGQGAHMYNQYAQVPSVEATAQADTVTVFLRSKTLWPFKHNDAYWDDAELTVVGEEEEEEEEGEEKPAEVQLSCQPPFPRIGDKVTIEARSLSGLTNVSLVIRQPSGAELARQSKGIGRDGDWYTWKYVTSPLSEVGTHQVAFSAAGEVKLTAVFESAAAAPGPRGLPRVQYKRTYVLLPPDADAAWALAAVDGVWDKHRYTIGSSADDAGIGDLDVRRVIAVNPEKWPSDLRAFFEEHYPGVEYTAIRARDAQELREKLKTL